MQDIEMEPFDIEELPPPGMEPELTEDDLVDLGERGDGSLVFGLGKKKEEGQEKEDFYRNLAEDMEGAVLSSLATQLLDDIKEDLEARKEWESTIDIVMKYLGFKVDEFRNVPFFRACAAFDSTLAK